MSNELNNENALPPQLNIADVKVSTFIICATITKVKDSWNKEEVIKLIKLVYIEGGKSSRNLMRDFDLDKWIENNL